jgi:hypothetical protein
MGLPQGSSMELQVRALNPGGGDAGSVKSDAET